MLLEPQRSRGPGKGSTVSSSRTVLHVGGLHYASEKAVVERVLSRRAGVLGVEANPVAQTATIEFDPRETSIESLRSWIEECCYHCAGRSVPGHVCDPLAETGGEATAHDPAAAERAGEAHGDGHGGYPRRAFGEGRRAGRRNTWRDTVLGHPRRTRPRIVCRRARLTASL